MYHQDQPQADTTKPWVDTAPLITLASMPIVGIGASAGGVVALQQFFSQLPPETGMAFVVIVHLSPDHESNLDSVLQRSSAMPVQQVTDMVRVEPNMVFVIPPTKQLTMMVRVWVTACTTGEEAYSIAILLYEYSLTLEQSPTIQVFATDIDDEAIMIARQGYYLDTIAADVSPDRLQRFFTPIDKAQRLFQRRVQPSAPLPVPVLLLGGPRQPHLVSSHEAATPSFAALDQQLLARYGSPCVIVSNDVDRLAFDLRPSMLDDLGLLSALQQQAGSWSTHYGINIDLQVRARSYLSLLWVGIGQGRECCNKHLASWFSNATDLKLWDGAASG